VDRLVQRYTHPSLTSSLMDLLVTLYRHWPRVHCYRSEVYSDVIQVCTITTDALFLIPAHCLAEAVSFEAHLHPTVSIRETACRGQKRHYDGFKQHVHQISSNGP